MLPLVISAIWYKSMVFAARGSDAVIDKPFYVSAAWTAVVILLFLVYNKLTMVIFEIFNVYPLPIDSIRYMAADYTVEVRAPNNVELMLRFACVDTVVSIP